MAYLDGNLQLSVAQAITTTAASTTIFDVTGAGSGNATNMTFGTTNAGVAILPGIDLGAGLHDIYAEFDITTLGTGAGTVTFQVQAAIDNGSNSPGTYVTLVSSAAFVGTTLLKGNKIILAVPPFNQIAATSESNPRFYQFNYVVAGSATVSVTGSLLINPDTSQVGNIYGAGYVA